LYFSGGKRITRVNGEQQVVLMDEYLGTTWKLQERVKEGKAFDGCTLGLPDLTLTNIFSADEKKSASQTIICEGVLFEEKVIIKISSATKDEGKRDNSLEVEAAIYEKVVPLLTSGECKTFQKSLGVLVWNHMASTKQVLYKTIRNYVGGKEYIPNLAKMVVTKKAKGRKLSDWLTSTELPTGAALEDFVHDILFQIAYTLVVFEDFGLMHHDLHSQNVFVEKLPVPLHYSVSVDKDRTIIRDVSYFVQVYDFDHSTKVRSKFDNVELRNTRLDSQLCLETGECNEFYQNMDWFTILFYMNAIPQVQPIIAKLDLVERKLLHGSYGGYDLAHPGHSCICKNKDCFPCSRIRLGDKLITSPYQYLQRYESKDCTPAFSRPWVTRSERLYAKTLPVE
jgi:hypothetical protein